MTRRLSPPRRGNSPLSSPLLSLLVFVILPKQANAFSPGIFGAQRRSQHRHHSAPSLTRLFANSAVKNALYTQVISDVDDTLKSSGGVNVAGVALGGIDTQYARGEYYPGVAQFMLELSMYSGEGLDLCKTPPKVAILTARAEEFKMALELKDDSSLAVAFREAGEAAGIENWGLGPVLYGSVAEWVIQTRKGLRKFNNFERLLQQDPTGTILQVCASWCCGNAVEAFVNVLAITVSLLCCLHINSCISNMRRNTQCLFFYSTSTLVTLVNWIKKRAKQCCANTPKW